MMAGAYLKAPCLVHASMGTPLHTGGADWVVFMKGRGTGNSTTRGGREKHAFFGALEVWFILFWSGLFSYLFSDNVGSFFPSL